MRKASKDNAVIKLVRPGGIVELYKHPIKAAQVMERYPRHFVTPPDVFRFPNIVVKPESVLKPGEVFYIVPYHTIYHCFSLKVIVPTAVGTRKLIRMRPLKGKHFKMFFQKRR